MSHCISCEGPSDKKILLDKARQEAKIRANEEKKPFAVCKEETEGTYFSIDAFDAFAQHRLVIEVVSGL